MWLLHLSMFRTSKNAWHAGGARQVTVELVILAGGLCVVS
jgi:hypothetical protein